MNPNKFHVPSFNCPLLIAINHKGKFHGNLKEGRSYPNANAGSCGLTTNIEPAILRKFHVFNLAEPFSQSNIDF
jgi:hypothetical protein